MASLIARSAMSLTCRMLKHTKQFATKQNLQFVRQCKSLNLSTRSHSSLCKTTNSSFRNSSMLHKHSRFCSLHTEGDNEFSKFLEKEIGVEESTDSYVKNVPDIKDWKIQTDISNITMSKTVDGERITLKFNVVDSVNEENTFQDDGESEVPTQNPIMSSKPPFTVEIKKESGKVMSLKCSFPLDEIEEVEEGEMEEQDEELRDKFQIDEVCIYQGEQTDSTYSVLSATMDGTLYDLLMDYLDDRGVSSEFIDTMVNYSTCYEQRLYVKFLKDMKDFLEE